MLALNTDMLIHKSTPGPGEEIKSYSKYYNNKVKCLLCDL